MFLNFLNKAVDQRGIFPPFVRFINFGKEEDQL